MKKLMMLFIVALSATFVFASPAAETAYSGETVVLESLNASGQTIEVEVPYMPARIAILDMASLDIIDSLGYGDRVVGMASTTIDYLQDYVNKEGMANLGTIKEADLEAVMAAEPDVIFIGGRLAASYDTLSRIAPVIYISTSASNGGVVASVEKNARNIAKMFGAEKKVDELMADFKERISALHSFAEGKTALVGLVTSGSFNILGSDGRCSIISNEIGFNNLGSGDVTSTHGNESSFEIILSLDPQYIFILDRDTAIATQGAKLAQEVMENELVMASNAYKNGNIVYLANPTVWYTAEGGIQALDIMLSDLETALL